MMKRSLSDERSRIGIHKMKIKMEIHPTACNGCILDIIPLGTTARAGVEDKAYSQTTKERKTR